MAKRGRRPETATERFQRAIEARRELDKELKEMQRKGDPPSQQRGIDIVSRRLKVSERTFKRLLAEAARPVLITTSRPVPPERTGDTGRLQADPRDRKPDTGRQSPLRWDD